MKLIKTAILPILATFAIAANAAKPQLDAKLTVSESYIDGGNVYATLKITNQGKGPQKVLKWYTNLDEQHIFSVSRDGQKVAYQGPHYKRPAPVDKDFIKLAPGQSLEKTFELSSLYDMSETGNYSVTYDVHSFHLFGNKGQAKKAERKGVETLESNTVSFFMQGMPKRGGNGGGGGKPDKGGDSCSGSTCFTGRCDNTQKNQILSALDSADAMANDSVAYLNGNIGTRYESWFGTPTNSRVNKAKSNFAAINDAIDNEALTFDCSCKQSYFAYVYPNQPYKIYLCRAFWQARETGTDSRAGTIIHELSHFNVVAGTDDVVYGQSGARSLADSNPDQALNNADSHEYFAENTPSEN
ncbi:MAG: peptidase M35 [Gammaproteobacteria bacterium]|nr:peptidase M35 [Gammaproteobacteria bacterium]